VKRRDLLQKIGQAARATGRTWHLERQGAEHEVWALSGRQITIPRHREIKEITARAILRQLEEEFGRRWW
jgi:hypothetical protein